MRKIMLVCSAGMSTSLLVTKMEEYAKSQGIEAKIFAESEGEAKKYFDEIDIVMLGPQVRYILKKMKKQLDPKGVIVEVINTMDYGTMNGEAVFNKALELLGDK